MNPREPEIEGLRCVRNLEELPGNPQEWAISIITPPKASQISHSAMLTQVQATIAVVQQAANLGFQDVWLQPGAEDQAVVDFLSGLPNLRAIFGGPCVLVEMNCDESKL